MELLRLSGNAIGKVFNCKEIKVVTVTTTTSRLSRVFKVDTGVVSFSSGGVGGTVPS